MDYIAIAKTDQLVPPNNVAVLPPGALTGDIAMQEAVASAAVKMAFLKYNNALGSMAVNFASMDGSMAYTDSASYYARTLFLSRLQTFIEENAHVVTRYEFNATSYHFTFPPPSSPAIRTQFFFRLFIGNRLVWDAAAATFIYCGTPRRISASKAATRRS